MLQLRFKLKNYPPRCLPCTMSTATMAYILLFMFMLVAWSAILIGRDSTIREDRNTYHFSGLVFTFRVNRHHCEMCSTSTMCR